MDFNVATIASWLHVITKSLRNHARVAHDLAAGPFYMVSMAGEVKYSTPGVNAQPVVDFTF